MGWQIGVDVGGTFTDLLALDPERGVFRVAKVLSTPEDQSVSCNTRVRPPARLRSMTAA